MKYWAFISYSHRDKEWGDWLHRSLETWRTPRHLVGRDSRDGKVPARLYPVFRDRDELPTSASLSENIQTALRDSRYLVVICSTRSAKLRWVDEEVRSFKALGREDRVLCLIVDGEPNAADKPELKKEECFPEGVRFRVGSDRSLTTERTEPIAADARAEGDGRENARLKLLAGLLGVGFDELRQRERERVRRRRAVIAVSLFAAMLVVIAGLLAYIRAIRLEQARTLVEKQRADEKLAYAYALRAREASGRGDDAAAAVLFAESYAAHPSAWSGANAESALRSVGRLRAILETGSIVPVSPKRVAFAPDRRLVTAALDSAYGTRIWDLGDGRLVATLALGDVTTESLAISSSGNLLATGGFDGRARLWRLDSLQPVGRPMPERPSAPSIEGVAFPRADILVSWESSGLQRRWALDGTLQAEKRTGIDVGRLQTSPDGRIALLDPGRYGGTSAQLWDLVREQPVGPPLAHMGSLQDAAFRPDGAVVATASIDETVGLWDGRSGARRGTITFESSPRSVDFAPDGRIAIASGRAAQIWDAAGLTRTVEVMLHPREVLWVAFSADGTHVVTACADGRARIWDSVRGAPLGETLHHEEPVTWAAWTSEAIVTASGEEMRVWDPRLGGGAALVLSHDQAAHDVVFSPDGSRVATVGWPTRIWDAASGARVGKEIPLQSSATFALFSPDSSRIALGDTEHMARIYDARTGDLIGSPMRHDYEWVKLGAFSADGTRFVTGSRKTAQVWDAATGAQVGKAMEHSEWIGAVAFSADGSEVITASQDSLARRWSAVTGDPIGEATRKERLDDRSDFSPDASRVLTSHFALEARLWDTRTKTQIGSALRHDGGIRLVEFSRDGRVLATVDNSGARLWDTSSAAQRGATILAPGIEAIALSADGLWLAVSSGGSVQLFDTGSGDPVGGVLAGGGAVSFSQDVRRLAAAGATGTYVYDVGYLVRLRPPEMVLRGAMRATGLRLGTRGELEVLRGDEWRSLGAERKD